MSLIFEKFEYCPLYLGPFYFMMRVFLLYRNCDRLDVLVSKEPAAGDRRMKARAKVDQLKADVRHVQTSLGSINARQWQREREVRDR